MSERNNQYRSMRKSDGFDLSASIEAETARRRQKACNSRVVGAAERELF